MFFHIIFFIFQVQSLFFIEAKGNEEDIANFFNSALHCIRDIQRTGDCTGQERLFRELDDHTRTISAFLSISRFTEDPVNRQYVITLEALYRCFRSLLSGYETRQRSMEVTYNALVPPTTSTGLPGRPRYSISLEQISHCVSLGMSWQRISLCLGISRRTLYRHRQRLGVQPLAYAVMSNHALNSVVSEILQNTPNAGETYVLGSLRSRQIRIQRWRVRQSLQEVDPIGRSFRRRHAIRRRIYNVQTPNQLW